MRLLMRLPQPKLHHLKVPKRIEMYFNQFNHPVSVSVMLYLDDVPTYVVVVKRVGIG